MRALRIVIVIVATSSSAWVAAQEQDRPVADEGGLDEEARIVYQAGVLAYDEQRFENALEHFERAHELSGRPQLLYNIGLAADRLRRDPRAIEAYESYLRELPDAANRARVEERLGFLRSAHAEHVDEPRPSNGAAVALLTLGGASLAGSVVGAIWWADRADVVSQCEDRGCANTDTIERERNSAMGVTLAAGAVGLASIIAGAVLLAKSGDDDAEATRCGVFPGGVTCTGRF